MTFFSSDYGDLKVLLCESYFSEGHVLQQFIVLVFRLRDHI